MKATMRVENPDDVEVTMTLTMPLGAWKKLRSQLDSSSLAVYPACDLWKAITELSAQTQQTALRQPVEVPETAVTPEPVIQKVPTEALKRRAVPAQVAGAE